MYKTRRGMITTLTCWSFHCAHQNIPTATAGSVDGHLGDSLARFEKFVGHIVRSKEIVAAKAALSRNTGSLTGCRCVQRHCLKSEKGVSAI